MWNSTSSPHVQREAGLRQPRSAALQHAPRVDRHRRAVLEPRLRPQPPGAGAQGSSRKLAGSGSSSRLLAKPKPGSAAAAAGLEHLLRGAVGGVLEHHRADHADAFSQRPRRRRRHQRLAAQHAVQVAPAEAHQFERSVSRSAARRCAPPARPRRGRRSAARTPSRGLASGRAGCARPRSQGAPARLAAAAPATVGPGAGRRDAVDRVGAAHRRGRRRRRAPSAAAPPARTVSIAFSSVRRFAMITLSLVPRCSRVRSWIGPMLSTAHWSCRLMSSSPMPR